MKNRPKFLIISGSPQGARSNSAQIITWLKKNFKKISFEVIHLAQTKKSASDLFDEIQQSQAILFITGTYWDSWGSPLQKFLEDFTPYEGHHLLLGKPAGVITLMHSVGGKEILSRLQGVLSTLGFQIPPMSGMAYSLVSELALRKKNTTHAKDFWSLEDLTVILNNLELASQAEIHWKSWPVDRNNPQRRWLKV